MIGPAPEVRWGNKLKKVDKNGPNHMFNLRLTPDATDQEKHEFESYVMTEMGGGFFAKKAFPKLEDPYYTWEGKAVERSTLKGRSIPTVKKRQIK